MAVASGIWLCGVQHFSGRFPLTGKRPLAFKCIGAIGAVVARFVHTEEVTGSNPVSPTDGKSVPPRKRTGRGGLFCFHA